MTGHFYPPNLMEYATKMHTLNLSPSINIYDVSDDLCIWPDSIILAKDLKELVEKHILIYEKFKKRLDFNDFCNNVVDYLIPYLYLYKKIDHIEEDNFFLDDINVKVNLSLYEQLKNSPEQLNTMFEIMYDIYQSKKE